MFYTCYWVTPVGNYSDGTKICAHSDLTADSGWIEPIPHLGNMFIITNMFILMRKILKK